MNNGRIQDLKFVMMSRLDAASELRDLQKLP